MDAVSLDERTVEGLSASTIIEDIEAGRGRKGKSEGDAARSTSGVLKLAGF
jgi:hypothetical protein